MDSCTEFMKIMKKEVSVPVILWGTGYYYHTVRDYIKHSIAADYIHDKKWDNSNITEFDGYPVISFEEMKKIGNCAVIVCLMDRSIEEEIYNELSINMEDAQIYQLRDIVPIGRNLKKEEIINMSDREGVYKDFYGNCIEYGTPASLNKVNIWFNGSNARIKLGKDIWIANELNIECGNDAVVRIGDATTFDKTTLYSSYGDIQIGDDCMFSYGVYVRNHDSHFIFDAETGNRINYSRKIDIKDHVWIGQNSILLAGFTIGNDAIVGAGSVSSSAFPDKVVIGGNPAQIIREGVIWNRSMTWTENYDSINEIK